MCLAKVTKRYLVIPKEKPLMGWKAIELTKLPLTHPTRRKKKPTWQHVDFTYAGHTYKYGEWDKADANGCPRRTNDIDIYNFSQKVDSYPAGFHIFRTRKGAEAWSSGSYSSIIPSTIPVWYYGAVTRGKQDYFGKYYACDVAEFMWLGPKKPPEVIEREKKARALARKRAKTQAAKKPAKKSPAKKRK